MSSDSTRNLNYLDIPYDVQLNILKYCDMQSLGRLRKTCRTLNDVVSSSPVWDRRSRNVPFTNQTNKRFCERSAAILTPRQKCVMSYKWKTGNFTISRRMVTHERFIPWLQMDESSLWCSRGETIFCYDRGIYGILFNTPAYSLDFHFDDVVRFCCTSSYIISGGRDRRMCIWQKCGASLICHISSGHQSDINCVSSDENIILSGSRDKTVKIWSFPPNPSLKHVFEIGDNIWDVRCIPDTGFFATGSAGLNVHPLQLFDAERCVKVAEFGSTFRRGSGVSHICPESAHEILTSGYDSTVRLWDIRTPQNCVSVWDDPYDSVVYCVDSDHHISFVSGTTLHGLTCLWDKRFKRCVQAIYSGVQNSPVYSVAFDPCCLFVALDRGIYMYSFYLPENCIYSKLE